MERNLRQIPATEALAEQKLLNLDTFWAFWRSMLMRDSHSLEKGTGASTHHIHVTFGRVVKTETLHEFYLRYCQQMRDQHPLSLDGMGVALKKYCSDLRKKEPTVLQREELKLPAPCARRYVGEVYLLPDLEQARRAFEAALRQPVNWPEAVEQDDDTAV